jgi:hypothetical protein
MCEYCQGVGVVGTYENTLPKSYEKGYKQHSDGEFGWCTDGEMDQNILLWRPTGLRCRLLQGFSDSLIK